MQHIKRKTDWLTLVHSGPLGSCRSSSRSRRGYTQIELVALAGRSPVVADRPVSTHTIFYTIFQDVALNEMINVCVTYTVIPTSQTELTTHACTGWAVISTVAMLCDTITELLAAWYYDICIFNIHYCIILVQYCNILASVENSDLYGAVKINVYFIEFCCLTCKWVMSLSTFSGEVTQLSGMYLKFSGHGSVSTPLTQVMGTAS